jgi:hypothetical protein
MGSLFLRSLGLVALFEALAVTAILPAARRRTAVVLGLLAGIVLLGVVQRRTEPALFLASGIFSGLLVRAAVRRGRGVWATTALGMAPVVLAATVELTGAGQSWSDLRAQVETIAGARNPPPSGPDPPPEEKRLQERTHAIAVLAATWALRLLPMEIAGMALLQVLPLVAFAGAIARRLHKPVAVPPVAGWTVPFAAVWALAFGLALVATRQRVAVVVGANIAALVGLWLAVQGFAVVLAFFGRGGPPFARGFLLLAAALLAWPFLVSACAILGIADLWVDFRRLRRKADSS